MKLHRSITSCFVVFYLTLTSQTFAADPVVFDPTGGGAENIIVGTFDWSPGNALSIQSIPLSIDPSSPTASTVVGQARLGVLLDPGNGIIDLPALGVDYELTFVMSFGELGHAASSSVGVFSFDPDNTMNSFKIYQSQPNSDDLSGTGFDDGTLILSGKIVAANSTFAVTDGAITYDLFHADDYGIQTVQGIGVTAITVEADFAHTGFFPADMPDQLFFNTSQVVPFRQADPSQLFVNDNGGPVQPVLGAINGVSGPDIQFQADANNSFSVIPDITPLACRVTGGGVDTNFNWDHTLESGETIRNGAGHLPDGIDRYQFGGQGGAPTGAQPQPSGEWTHHQQTGPSGSFTFHGGTASAPEGTEIDAIRCSDPGYCRQARPAPTKQIDFDGIGTFRNLGHGRNAPDFVLDNSNLVAPKNNRPFTYHWFEVNIDDLGERGGFNTGAPNSATCPSDGFGEKGRVDLANCDCPDYYRITIYNGISSDDVTWDGDSIDPSSLNRTDVLYEVFGYIDGGNLQIHPSLD